MTDLRRAGGLVLTRRVRHARPAAGRGIAPESVDTSGLMEVI